MEFTVLDNRDKDELQAQIDDIKENGSTGGADGEDGATFIPSVSADGIISWTNDKGLANPSPINIKGDKGDTGAAGVGVASIAINEDGELVITYTEGNPVNLGKIIGPQGAQGLQGEKGDKGDPYTLTEADKAEIVQTVIERLGGNPVFGYVDENNNIIVSGNLADGTYTVKYEMEDGSTVDIGDLVLDTKEEPEIPTITNLLPLSVDANGNDFVGGNGEDGYKYGYRISRSNGNETATDGVHCSGFMPVTLNDTIYIENITLNDTETYNNVIFYDSSKSYITGQHIAEANGGIKISENGCTIKPNEITSSQSVAFFRFSIGSITDKTIVTVNQEIL